MRPDASNLLTGPAVIPVKRLTPYSGASQSDHEFSIFISPWPRVPVSMKDRPLQILLTGPTVSEKRMTPYTRLAGDRRFPIFISLYVCLSPVRQATSDLTYRNSAVS
ncbi:hypothetical protein AVEN_4312-1 [Araneus ventricosus]|uniref:Uncharacterized protein n=1 Tax=Araneus ventricosus TaxID=182803 RepID=A0A4Y2GGF1_ARAVE|nr:hypothetical protein AVEN_4312-1 [Araneus ventricosus]